MYITCWARSIRCADTEKQTGDRFVMRPRGSPGTGHNTIAVTVTSKKHHFCCSVVLFYSVYNAVPFYYAGKLLSIARLGWNSAVNEFRLLSSEII